MKNNKSGTITKQVIDTITPRYRLVEELKPFCPKCEQRLSGNGSVAFLYKCDCGTWKPNSDLTTFRVERPVSLETSGITDQFDTKIEI